MGGGTGRLLAVENIRESSRVRVNFKLSQSYLLKCHTILISGNKLVSCDPQPCSSVYITTFKMKTQVKMSVHFFIEHTHPRSWSHFSSFQRPVTRWLWEMEVQCSWDKDIRDQHQLLCRCHQPAIALKNTIITYYISIYLQHNSNSSPPHQRCSALYRPSLCIRPDWLHHSTQTCLHAAYQINRSKRVQPDPLDN